MKKIIFIILFILLIESDIYSNNRYLKGYFNVGITIGQLGNLCNDEIKKEIDKITKKINKPILISNGIIQVDLHFVLPDKEFLKEQNLMLSEKKLKVEKIEKEKGTVLSEIPDKIVLFNKNIPISNLLKVYFIYPDGKRKEVTKYFDLEKLSSETIVSKKNKRTIDIVFVCINDEFKSRLPEGCYTIEVIYDSTKINGNNLWRGKICLENGYSEFYILHPKNEIQKILGYMIQLRYYAIKNPLKAKNIGEKIKNYVSECYFSNLYLGMTFQALAYKVKGKNKKDEYKKKAYIYYVNWLKILDKEFKGNRLMDNEKNAYYNFYYKKILKQVKKLEIELNIPEVDKYKPH